MTIRNEPGAYGFLAGLLVLLFGLVVNDGCISNQHTARLKQQYEAAVDISVVCMKKDSSMVMWYGSGVIIDSEHVLTAGHVADDEGAMCSYLATTIDGKSRTMFVKHLDKTFDLADLELSLGQPPFETSGLRFGPKPHLGDEVCAAPANPHRWHKCGEVQPDSETPGDVVFSMIVEPGNSGSGLYNADGELVGIVTHRWNCANGQWCGGKAASLDGHLKDLLE